VYVPEPVQKKRLMERDAMSETEAAARIAAQMPIEEKRARADYLVDNGLGLDVTGERVREILEILGTRAQAGASERVGT
jgi:dephospho-CoA kinase